MASDDFNKICTSVGGWSEQKVAETLKNKDLSKRFQHALKEVGNVDKPTFNLLYQVCSKIKPQIMESQSLLIKYISEKKLANETQIQAALDWLLANLGKPFDAAKFEEATGVGVIVKPEDVEHVAKECLAKFKDDLTKLSAGKMIAEVRAKLKWADGKIIKDVVDKQVAEFKAACEANPDLQKKKPVEESPPGKKPAGKSPAGKAQTGDDTDVREVDVADFISQSQSKEGVAGGIARVIRGAALTFHKTGENYTTDGYVVTPKTMQLLAEHLEKVKKMAAENNLTYPIVVTRFPPEPNGILHIGHAKAINFNFGFAKANGGLCYLRYDDTNPEKEDERFVRGIREMVEWLGYKPYKITHASDNFEKLYEYATELVRRGLAYVCHQKGEEIKGVNAPPSPWRDRPIEESLRLFEDMRRGLFDEGEATLRMKLLMEDGKLDPVAYRVKFKPHPQTGSAWCIYPTYDFTHCLCDSIENITHSLCTKEFQNRRSAYYWVCNSLDVYCPVQWEYGRMNLYYTVLSKRKIEKLIQLGIVSDWNDPRLYTLSGQKRRGVPPEAVHLFVAKIGVTMAQTCLDPAMLDSCCREVLNLTAPRAMVCLDPLPIEIVNLPADAPKSLNIPDFPANENSATHTVVFSSRLFIERSDFAPDPSTVERGYKRLMQGQSVGLKYAGLVVSLKEVVKDATGAIKELKVEVVQSTEKPKAFIHWVESSSSIHIEVRIYNKLFKSKNPEEVEGGYLADLNENSLVVLKSSRADQSVKNAGTLSRYQFERHGYFCVDNEKSTFASSGLVFNRTLELKEDKGKS